MSPEQHPETEAKRGPGRPPREMPSRIDATPDEIAEVVLRTPPPKEWQYLKRAEDTDEAS